jgi:hypothetical protein
MHSGLYRRRWFVALLLFAFPCPGSAHGGVVAEDDLCVINIGYLRAHFKIYVPEASGHDDYCEDIPVRGASLFVMEYQHDGLSDASIEFRIIENVTGKGTFARLEDVEAIKDLEAVTVRYEPPTVVPDVYTLLQDFPADGEYVGIVKASNAETDKVYTAVFPFEVGNTGIGIWPWILLGLALLQLNFWYWSRRRMAPAVTAIAIAVTCYLDSDGVLAENEPWPSDRGYFVISYSTELDPVPINRMHSWILTITDSAGAPVQNARVTVTGGMPEHDHGLPTLPQVLAGSEPGQYRVDGLRFHMRGYWEILVSVDNAAHRDLVKIAFEL